MKTILSIISAGLLFIATSCNKSQDAQPASSQSSDIQQRPDGSGLSLQTKTVYYSNQLFNVKLRSWIEGPQALVNTYYVILSNEPGTAMQYLPVIDKLPSGNFYPTALWQLVNIKFNLGARPYQVRSAEEMIKLIKTNAVTAEKTGILYEMEITYGLDPTTK
jgi:hypothetical protein